MKNLKIKLKTKGNKSISFEDIDIIQNCWNAIFELERNNPKTLDDFSVNNSIDELLQNYFSLKLIYSEYKKETTKEMEEIEDFVTKYMKQFCNAIETEKLKNNKTSLII